MASWQDGQGVGFGQARRVGRHQGFHGHAPCIAVGHARQGWSSGAVECGDPVGFFQIIDARELACARRVGEKRAAQVNADMAERKAARVEED